MVSGKTENHHEENVSYDRTDYPHPAGGGDERTERMQKLELEIVRVSQAHPTLATRRSSASWWNWDIA